MPYAKYEELREKLGADYDFRVWNEKGEPQYRGYVPGEELPVGWSILPFFPNYVWTGTSLTGYMIFWMLIEPERILSIFMNCWRPKRKSRRGAKKQERNL